MNRSSGDPESGTGVGGRRHVTQKPQGRDSQFQGKTWQHRKTREATGDHGSDEPEANFTVVPSISCNQGSRRRTTSTCRWVSERRFRESFRETSRGRLSRSAMKTRATGQQRGQLHEKECFIYYSRGRKMLCIIHVLARKATAHRADEEDSLRYTYIDPA